jgi:Flp pilus assembly protein TadB
MPQNSTPQEIFDMMKHSTKFLSIAALSLAFVTVAGTASADTKWQKNHPRREQVNNRLANQNKRIKNEVKEGDLTKSQAASLHKEDRQIRQEERDMASQNGGHITKSEQKTLNQQENAVSKQIGQ